MNGDQSSSRSRAHDASRYAQTAEGNLIDICDVRPDDRYARGPYSCLACGHLMVPALGHIRKHHFKHKAGRPAHCHNETYLHQLGKIILFSILREAILTGQPYWLTRDRPVVCSHYKEQFGLTCTAQRAPYMTDLATIFDKVELEVGVEGFVADVLLSSSTSSERMLLEIVVTHACEETKISSGLPIIELYIESEEAANRLWEGIDVKDRHTVCHNLPRPEAAPYQCSTPCSASGLALLLYNDGKAWYSELAVGSQNEEDVLADQRLVTHAIVDVHLGNQTRSWEAVCEHLSHFIIQQAFHQGRRIRSCMLCRSNGGRVNDHDIICLAKGRKVWMSSSATSCPHYDPPEDRNEARLMLDNLGGT